MSYGGFVDADNRAVSIGISDDKAIALLIKYIGAQQSGTVTVAAGGDVTFKHGAQGAEANDTSIGGAADAGATLDVSEVTEDTLGECVDLINGSSNWMAVIVDGLRSDSSNDTFLAAAAAQAKIPQGYKVYFDTDVFLKAQVLVAPEKFRTDIRTYMYSADGRFSNVYKVFVGTEAEVKYAYGGSTYGAGTSVLSVVSDDGTTETVFFSEAAAASPGFKNFAVNPNAPLRGLKDQRVIVRIVNSNAMASSVLQVSGSLKRVLSA